jgi:hypothetical protein
MEQIKRMMDNVKLQEVENTEIGKRAEKYFYL